MPKSRLQIELQQSKPFRSVAQEAWLSILRTADHLKRTSQTSFDMSGLTQQQYNVLRILRGAGESGLPTLAIASRLIEHTPGITRLLDRLEAKHLIARGRPTQDRRQVTCTITPLGSELLSKLDEKVDSLTTAALHGVSEQELRDLIRTLEKIRNPNIDPASDN
ncbi:MAG: MarR family transcriptional regulator [Bryobacter sp.]